ncbi:MAG: hypothetical protein CMN32_09720 [Saprospirales bacterium]|nr:hypothetical protein [Saprospirales bacterium]
MQTDCTALRMTYRPTMLNISTAISLTKISIYATWNYKTLSASEGWGIVTLFGLAGIGVVAGFADLILQRLVKKRKAINIVGLLIVAGLAFAILSYL